MGYQQLLLALLGSLGLYLAYKLAKVLYDQWTSPLRALPGPPSSSWIYGNMKEIYEAENSVLHEKWVEEYGSTITYKAYFGMNRFYTTDVKAVNHILMNDYIYQKPEQTRFALSRVLGNGVLVVEEDKHKQQNPAFGPAHIRELTEIFVDKAIELRDVWKREIDSQGETGRVEILSWLSKMTLDVIGQAGFNYKFNALSNAKSELNDAFSILFQSSTRISLLGLIKVFIPALRFIPSEGDAKAKAAMTTMKRVANELLRDSKMGLMAEDNNTKMNNKSLKGRDLLSLLLRANTSKDLPAHQRMSDEDVMAQVPTFLVAGHETTSVATTWALYALCLDIGIQDKLREELLAVGTDNPTMDELNSLPYLDAVVRETLRVHSPVGSTIRVAVKDDIIPLGKPVRDRNGKLLDGIPVRKGQSFLIPVLALNRDKSIWGSDAGEFKPERWQNTPPRAGSIPGVWGNMMSFLGGPRACIGYRFSLVEMKALLFTLIRAFEFELGVPKEDIIKKTSLVQRPLLKSDMAAGNQMPLILKPVSRISD
ncbi:Cytochrome P450 monooxygenase 169 [Psilocybe cubensis]|uniref:Cytochrome P450 n=2 Tax=Psilocybe cubensis TaxID=181762 RepID=A0A8H7Y1U0_PSICU|nr:Cytochrome P450 monooxygenase 169 [Psilocybe cubensis]KAH9483655.1 Cytochrome P450 monooxygenase 169 [Psilocybe cubensis]